MDKEFYHWAINRRKKLPLLWRCGSKITMSTVGILGKFWIGWLNTFKVYNKEALLTAIEKRKNGRGLITASNHYSCLDEPLIWGMVSNKYLINRKRTRWAIGAHDVCFTNYWNSLLFSLGKTVPIVRGNGVHQLSLDVIIEQLNTGDWVHIFPEGKVNVDKERLRLKWGIGRLLSESITTPLVVPIWHIGMDDILPNKKPYIPQIRKTVTYVVGEPIDFTADVTRLKSLNKSPKEIRKYLTDIVQDRLFKLRDQTELLHKQNTQKS